MLLQKPPKTMGNKLTLKCGCSFEKLNDINVDLPFTEESLKLDCPTTWKYIAENAKGLFQIESQLGQSLAKKLAPENIEELSALLSIMRPGVLEAILDGKSVTDRYIDRKHGREPITYYHDALKPSLEKTYGMLIYQEQVLQIARDLAHFTLQEADSLRKAIGKKLPEEMAKMKTLFIEKAKLAGVVSDKDAEEIFNWIEKSQRYLFNKSHSISYAIDCYLSAYCKAHFTKAFFTSWGYWSKEKSKPSAEMRELINNARSLDIEIVPPSFLKITTKNSATEKYVSKHFMLRDKKVYVGFTDIKGVGEQAVDKLLKKIPEIEQSIGVKYQEWTWLDFLLFCTPIMNTTVVKCFIHGGTLNHFGLSRTKMTYEYDILQRLTEKEIQYIKRIYIQNYVKYKSLDMLLQDLIEAGTGQSAGVANKARMVLVIDILKLLTNPPYELVDCPEWLAGIELALYGTPLTCTRVEGKDTASANCTCQEFNKGKRGYNIIAVQIDRMKEIKTKNGKTPGSKMAFLSVSDITGSVENVVVFPEEWKVYSGICVEGNIVLIGGEKGKSDNSFIVKKVWQI